MNWQTETRAWALASAGVFCLSSIGYRVVTAPKLPDLAATVGKLNTEIDEVHRATVEIGLTAREARKASANENKYLPQWNSGITQTLADLHETMLETQKTVASIQPLTEQATSTLKTTQETVKALQEPIEQANTTIAALQPFIAHSDALVTDPAIAATLSNVQSTTGHVDATTKDVQDAVHKYTHPGIWTKIKGFALDVAHVFNPL